MILTLKLVGLAFEVNSVYLSNKKKDDDDEEYNRINPTFDDIIHYSFNYIGVLTGTIHKFFNIWLNYIYLVLGPYYRYRTFVDYFDLPYAEYATWKEATIMKIKYVPLYAIMFLITSYYWPLSVRSNFYNNNVHCN